MRRISPTWRATSVESARWPILTARSTPSSTRLIDPIRQAAIRLRPPDIASDKHDISGLTCRRPNPTGADTTSRPLGRVRSPSAAPSASSISAEYAPGPLQIAGADIGQRHRPGGPLQQPRAETILQRRDQPRHRRMATARACAPPAQTPAGRPPRQRPAWLRCDPSDYFIICNDEVSIRKIVYISK